MAILADRIEGELRTHRLPGLNLPVVDGEVVFPAYDGLSIANLPVTIAALLGVPWQQLSMAPPVQVVLGQPWATGIRQVVLVVVDALGYGRLRALMATEPDLAWNRVADAGLFIPLTSVFPSTTTAAITSLWTGRTPQEHGMLGFVLYLREFGVVAEMIRLMPLPGGVPDQLFDLGLDPNTFVPVPSLAEHLAVHGVTTETFIHQEYRDSGLSRLSFRGVSTVHGFVTSSDMWVALRERLEARTGQPRFITVYWGAVDGIAHSYGPSRHTLDAEVRNLAYSFQREFLDELSPAARRDTLLLVTADHGQVDTPPSAAIRLADHPGLVRQLVLPPTGDPRAVYLFARHGRANALRDYLARHLTEQFIAVDSELALKAGLFGTGTPHPATLDRIGDLLLLARRNHILYPRTDEIKVQGLHGALSPDEMLVPLITVRLDEM